MNKLFVVSDGSGRTAEQILMAALTQFPDSRVEIVLRPEVRTEQAVEEIVSEVAEEKGFILHTLVSESLRECVLRLSRIHNVDAIDLMGPLLSRLSHHFADSPKGEPGLFFSLNQEYFKRIDAMQFAFTHDDGQRDYDYDKAEIILVGVSRTFKTPLSIYLAFKGWFVANFPVVLGSELPDILKTLEHGRVFGLMTEPQDLCSLRSVRQQYLGGFSSDYTSMNNVKRELNYAMKFFCQYEWPVVHVTNKPIEEIATEILTIKKRIDLPGYVRKKCE
ncbi:MAG: kinase/pyrophosphorylase [Bacteroidetes bacterium]|nr:kinase/pyrophosphorylase [Bacteroidota bacterium]